MADHLTDLRQRLHRTALGPHRCGLQSLLPSGLPGLILDQGRVPALLPDEGWSDLEIADGQEAAIFYQQALAADDPGARESTFNKLRAHCGQDTLAMAKLMEALRAVQKRS